MTHPRWLIFAALALATCTSGKLTSTADSETDADTDADADSDADSDADTDPISEFGLDTRPANPTCVAPEPPLPTGDVVVTRVFDQITANRPMMMLEAPGDPSHWYFIEKSGYLWRFDNTPSVAAQSLVLDIHGSVNTSGNEMGLLGMAFHPDFQSNGYLYLYYSSYGGTGNHEAHLSRFTSTDGGGSFDPSTELVLLRIDEPFDNHNGGTIAFGPDGDLYLGLGDGGSGGDPYENGQNTFTWLAKMLRIDVDGGTPYAIPADNPFASGVDGLPEIYAWGLRNPFRWSFDAGSGDLWVGDVGQNLWEEVDQLALGGNYGWNVREGDECYLASVCANTYQFPETAYYHDQGGEAIIGGTVYRGAAIPALQGVYLFNDWVQQDIIGLSHDPVTGEIKPLNIVDNPGFSIVHYAADSDGELYLVDYNNGRFWKLEPGPATSAPDPFPQHLSETGCFDAANPSEPVDAMVPYTVNHAFWSDGASKRRWLAVPDGTSIAVDASGDWDLPVGSVLGKEFTKDGVRIETRLLMRHPDGSWGGYSYLWNSVGTDADLVYGSRSVELPSETWEIPGAECGRCHTAVAGSSLGLRTGQLNGLETYPSTGRTANQLATLEHIGLFADPIGDPATLDAYPAIDDQAATIEARARRYLDVNCSQCHQPDGPTHVNLDFRATTALADMGICGDPEQGDLGVTGAKIVTAGDPALSVLSLRIHRRGVDQMPPLATQLVDTVGVDVIDQWITGLASCP